MIKSATNKLRFSLYKLNISLRAVKGQEFKFEQRKNIFNRNIANRCLKIRIETKIVISKIGRLLGQI